jgi:CheY-like chemotaxis protein
MDSIVSRRLPVIEIAEHTMQTLALIVDDEPHMLTLMQEVLRPFQMDVLRANDGEEAIAILEHYTPHLVLLDMLMPHVNGLDVLSYIASSARLEHSFVVVVTAHQQYQLDAQASRADAYLLKPIHPRELRAIIQQAMVGRAAS